MLSREDFGQDRSGQFGQGRWLHAIEKSKLESRLRALMMHKKSFLRTLTVGTLNEE